MATIDSDARSMIDSQSIPENWEPLLAELEAYYRTLPELLGKGEAGRFVVIKGGRICQSFDSYNDAVQYGNNQFGDQLHMVHRVDSRDQQRLAKYFPTRS